MSSKISQKVSKNPSESPLKVLKKTIESLKKVRRRSSAGLQKVPRKSSESTQKVLQRSPESRQKVLQKSSEGSLKVLWQFTDHSAFHPIPSELSPALLTTDQPTERKNCANIVSSRFSIQWRTRKSGLLAIQWICDNAHTLPDTLPYVFLKLWLS